MPRNHIYSPYYVVKYRPAKSSQIKIEYRNRDQKLNSNGKLIKEMLLTYSSHSEKKNTFTIKTIIIMKRKEKKRKNNETFPTFRTQIRFLFKLGYLSFEGAAECGKGERTQPIASKTESLPLRLPSFSY